MIFRSFDFLIGHYRNTGQRTETQCQFIVAFGIAITGYISLFNIVVSFKWPTNRVPARFLNATWQGHILCHTDTCVCCALWFYGFVFCSAEVRSLRTFRSVEAVGVKHFLCDKFLAAHMCGLLRGVVLLKNGEQKSVGLARNKHAQCMSNHKAMVCCVNCVLPATESNRHMECQ